MGQVLNFPHVPKLEKLADDLWMMRLSDTPESQAQADRIVKELRDNNYVVPEHMKGNDHEDQ